MQWCHGRSTRASLLHAIGHGDSRLNPKKKAVVTMTLTRGKTRRGTAPRWLTAVASPSSSLATAWASSSGALAPGIPPTVVVKSGEGPLGDESVREASSQLGGDNTFAKRVAVGFGAPRG
jgi:hypothetical protein